ncbi:hypothetical protein KW785_03015 [Candidatus Parcubacteria bacterium]|nr:hypothetical protein [Candidatus Parcubacteria bacterium]
MLVRTLVVKASVVLGLAVIIATAVTFGSDPTHPHQGWIIVSTFVALIAVVSIGPSQKGKVCSNNILVQHEFYKVVQKLPDVGAVLLKDRGGVALVCYYTDLNDLEIGKWYQAKDDKDFTGKVLAPITDDESVASATLDRGYKPAWI